MTKMGMNKCQKNWTNNGSFKMFQAYGAMLFHVKMMKLEHLSQSLIEFSELNGIRWWFQAEPIFNPQP